MDVAGPHQRPEPPLVDVALADQPVAVEAEPLEPPVEVEPRRRRSDEQEPRPGCSPRRRRERLEELRHALARVDVPERADSGSPAIGGRRDAGTGQAGCGTRAIGPSKPAARARSRDVARSARQAVASSSTSPASGKSSRPGLPERRQPLVEHAVAEQPPDDAVLALHRVEVAVPVAAPDGDARDQVVEHEVVEDDEAGRPAQGVEDPAVRVRVVADVVDGEVDPARRPLRPALHELDVDVLAQRGQEERRVVRDPGALRRHRREVGDLHASSLAIARSQVTSSASCLPAAPNAAASSSCVAEPRGRARHRRRLGRDDEPRPAVVHDVERAAGVGRRDHRLAGEERLERPHPEVLVDRRVEDRGAVA